MPLYNKRATIARTLGCALAQTLAEIEIIVVDDGSTDGSVHEIAGCGDTRLKIIQQPNAGVSAARNAGAKAARAQWLALVDADDEWMPEHLARLLDCVEGSGAIAAFSNQRLQSLDGAPAIAADVAAQRIDNYFRFAMEHGGYPISASSVLVRRAGLMDCGLFPPGVAMGEDLDTWARLACRGAIVYNAAITAVYNDAANPGSVATNLQRAAVPPFFSRQLPGMLARGEVPAFLRRDARRYANFLELEYARQLLDRGDFNQARQVLMNRCKAWLDPFRFGKRLGRTFAPGRAVFQWLR